VLLVELTSRIHAIAADSPLDLVSVYIRRPTTYVPGVTTWLVLSRRNGRGAAREEREHNGESEYETQHP
jgi:hypothetical protein